MLVNYTINNFGNIENKPDWIGNLTNNGTYYFVVQEDGTLKPNKDATTTYVDGTPIENRMAEQSISIRNLKGKLYIERRKILG